MRVQRFEDLEVWQLARRLTNEIYDLSGLAAWGRDFGLRDQVRRAAVSIVSNIAEGFERGGDKEFALFLSHAKGSAGELRAQLYIAFDRKYTNELRFNQLQEQVEQISRMLSNLSNYLNRSTLRGSKFRHHDHPQPATPPSDSP